MIQFLQHLVRQVKSAQRPMVLALRHGVVQAVNAIAPAGVQEIDAKALANLFIAGAKNLEKFS